MKSYDMTQEDRDLNAACQANFASAEAAKEVAQNERLARLANKPDVPADANSILALKTEVEVLTEKVNLLLAIHRGEI